AIEAPPQIPRDLDKALRLFARNEIEDVVGPAAQRVVIARRELDHEPPGNRDALLAVFREDVDLRAEIQVADIVAGPILIHAGIPVDDAAEIWLRAEQRPQVAVDSCVAG